ncbi:MAG TPA: RNA methyltransferase [Planctomycetes bacterium]|nr:RNA methyltransferase [Planctomycetota bacterium]
MSDKQYFVPCPMGVEAALEEELKALGASRIDGSPGHRTFFGPKELGYRACLWLRTAIRVQELLATFEARTEQEFYDGVYSLPWERICGVDRSLAVDASIRNAFSKHSKYVGLLTKDAVVDRIRDRLGRRPNVDTHDPDLPLKITIQENKVYLYRNLNHRSLHKRGYRPVQVKSPLNEALAAGLILLSGWDRKSSLIDPMCGSGTFLLEAAGIALGLAPGLGRSFAFERFHDFDPNLWADLRQHALDRERDTHSLPSLPLLQGADRHGGALEIARTSRALAGLEGKVRFFHTELKTFHPGLEPSMVITNPPYGHRIGTDPGELKETWKDLGDFLRRECGGGVAWILCGNKELTRGLRLRTERRIPVRNGSLDCRFLKYSIRRKEDLAK